MPKFIDITGKKYGMLTAVKYVRKINSHYYWMFRCNCGKTKIISKSHVVGGRTRSCGCLLNSEHRIKRLQTHGMSKTRFFNIWTNALSRCNNKNHPAFQYYGGKGIKVEWKNFIEFKNDMYQDYEKFFSIHGKDNTTLDRIDSNANYCKKNCRWATRETQSNNTKRVHRITFNNKTQSIAKWERELGFNEGVIYQRIFVYGWPLEKSFLTPTINNISQNESVMDLLNKKVEIYKVNGTSDIRIE